MSVAQPIRAAIYVRVSTLEQGERGYSLEAQARDCRALAGELGTGVVAEFSDTDSGASWDLPGLNALLDAAKRGEFDTLLVYDPDRLARRMAKQLVLEEELAKHGVRIVYATLRLGDTAEDRLLKNVRASVSEYEREKIKLRTLRGRREKAERGLVVGCGPAPYGYRYVVDGKGKPRGLEPNPETAPVVRRLYELAAGLPTADVAARLVADGIPGPRRQWTGSAVLGVVIRPVYAGTWVYGHRGRRIGPDDETDGTFVGVPVPPLVDRAAWDAVQLALRRRRTARPPRRPIEEDSWVLRGLLTCGQCGGALATRTNANNMGGEPYRYYTCLRSQPGWARKHHKPRCYGRDVLAGPLEALAWRLVAGTLLDPAQLEEGLAAARAEHDHADERRLGRVDTLDQEIDRLRARLAKIVAQRLDTEAGSEIDRLLLTSARDTEDMIGRLHAERDRLGAPPIVGLSPDAALSIQQFASEVRRGLESAAPIDRRQVFQLLDLRGTVRPDRARIKLGRKHRYALAWTARIGLADLNGRLNDHLVDCFRYAPLASVSP